MAETKNEPPPSPITLAQVNELIENKFKQLIPFEEQVIIKKAGRTFVGKSDATLVEDQKRGIELKNFLEFVRFFSTQASAANRSLALGGIAIIWIFKKPENQPLATGLLNPPLFLLALSLALDLLQYFFGAIAWHWFYEFKYRKWKRAGYKPEYVKDIVAPNLISNPILVLFIAKIISMAWAYVLLIKYLGQKI